MSAQSAVIDEDVDLLPSQDDEPALRIEPEEAKALFDSLKRRSQQSVYRKASLLGLQRFWATHDVPSSAQEVDRVVAEFGSRMESSLAFSRFAQYAIPTLGFIGTVRGLGLALGQASAPEKLSEVVGYLAIAFDTTLVALLCGLVFNYSSERTSRAIDEIMSRIRLCLSTRLLFRLTVPQED
jgi:biopolymer transport protein ExbB/TolQ